MRKLKFAVIGRTEWLYAAAEKLCGAGHELAAVATCRPSGHETVGEAEYRALASAANAPFYTLRDVQSGAAAAELAALHCDVAVSMNWLNLLPSVVRDQFRHGIFNAHPGDLPRYRGNACPNWALLAGESSIGLTVHQMVDALDAGPIAAKRMFAVHDDTYIEDVYAWLGEAVPNAFCEVVNAIATDRLRLEPQPDDPALSLRCYSRRPEDGLIQWDRDATSILRLIRASSRPFAGAYSFLEGQRRITIWRAERFAMPYPFLAVPGQVVGVEGDDPLIACADETARLTEIEADGLTTIEAKRLVLSSMRNRFR